MRFVVFHIALGILALPPTLAAQSARTVTLEEALAAGREQASAAVVARLDARLASARSAAATSVLLPRVDGTASIDRQTMNKSEFGISEFSGVTDPFTLYRARATLRQVIFDRSAWAAIGAMRDSLVASDADADRVGTLSAMAAGAAWLRLAAAEESVAARIADSTTAVELLRIATEQVAAGTAARIERTRSETRVAVTDGALTASRFALARASVDLAHAMDLPPGTTLDPVGDATIPLTLPTTMADAITTATLHRADLHAADARVHVSERRAAAVALGAWPSLGLTGMVQESGQHTGDLRGSWSIGLGLQWNLFDGFQRRHAQEEASLRVSLARTTRDALRNAVASEAEGAAIDVASAEAMVRTAAARLELATEELHQAEERFAAGVAGTIETTAAEAGVTEARDALIHARISLGAAHLAAASALGLLDTLHAPATAGESH